VRPPRDRKEYASTAKRIAERIPSESTVVTDVEITTESERHNFVLETLQDASIVSVPLSGFATGVAKLKPMLQ
jgi:hypothetical protein